MNTKNYIIIAIIIVLIAGGYFVYQNILETRTEPDKANKIYTVDELVKSNIKEGTEVLVKGGYTLRLINAGPDYEGPGGGYYIFGEEKFGEKGEGRELCLGSKKEGGMESVKLNQIITVKGKIRYCGGKKIAKYICGLTEVELAQVSEDKFPSENNVNDICKADTKEECESIPGCYWKYQGGKITAHYNCCPKDKDKEKSLERCNIMAD